MSKLFVIIFIKHIVKSHISLLLIFYKAVNISFVFYTKIGDMPLFKVLGERNPQKFCISANSLSDLKDKGTC